VISFYWLKRVIYRFREVTEDLRLSKIPETEENHENGSPLGILKQQRVQLVVIKRWSWMEVHHSDSLAHVDIEEREGSDGKEHREG
jgi:hypothetical protein